MFQCLHQERDRGFSEQSQAIRCLHPHRLDLVLQQREEGLHRLGVTDPPQGLGGVHPHDPVRTVQRGDEGVNDAGVCDHRENRGSRLLKGEITIREAAGQRRNGRLPDRGQRGDRRIAHGPVRVPERRHQRDHRPRIAGRPQGRGRFLADRPVLVLQSRDLFGNAVRHGEGLRSPLPERDSAAPHCRRSAGYEVSITDQSDTGKESGGFLYIYNGGKLAAKPSDTKSILALDLAGDVGKFCEDATKKPVRRPHMLFFTRDQSHAILSFLSGQVLFMDAESRKLEACLSMGKNVHAAWPTPDMKMVLAANIAEQKFIRIWTDYKAHKFTFDPTTDVMNLATEEGGERPDTAPICPITDASSKYAFITLRGGGLFVVDVAETPMKIVATLDNNDIHPAGCGGVQVGDVMYLNSGGGWPVAPLSYDVYALDISGLPKSVSAKLITSRDTRFSDCHGMVGVGRYGRSADRARNEIETSEWFTNMTA